MGDAHWITERIQAHTGALSGVPRPEGSEVAAVGCNVERSSAEVCPEYGREFRGARGVAIHTRRANQVTFFTNLTMPNPPANTIDLPCGIYSSAFSNTCM